MVDVGFSVGEICVRIARANFLKTHPLCHRPHPVLVQSVEKSKRRFVIFYCNLVVLLMYFTVDLILFDLLLCLL